MVALHIGFHLSHSGRHPRVASAGLKWSVVMLLGSWAIMFSTSPGFILIVHLSLWQHMAAAHLSLGPYTGVKKERTKGLRSILVSSDLFKIFPEASPGNFCLNLTVWNWVAFAFLAARVWEGKYFTFRPLKQKHARGEGVGLGVNLTPYVYNNECNLELPSSSANYEMVSQ